MDVSDWLRALDLGQYEAAFQQNAVTADLLASLTSEDLKDLGIAAVGHRRRLLDAIAALRPTADLTRIPHSGVPSDDACQRWSPAPAKCPPNAARSV